MTTISKINKVPFLNVNINPSDTETAKIRCTEFLNSQEQHKIYFLNAHCFNIAQKNDEYRNSLNNADIVFNDGIGIKLGSKIIGQEIHENMNGTDFIPKLIQHTSSLKKGVFLLGAKPGIVDIAKENLERKYGVDNIYGINHGFINKPEDKEKVIKKINGSNSEVLVVGMGVPLQEKWIDENLHLMPNIKIAVAGGAILDFLSENFKRAPLWMQKAGLEWIFRFIQEPFRLFNRYFIGNFIFFRNVFRLKKLYK